MCSSTDMERLASHCAANKRLKRPLVCDRFQKSILEIFKESAGKRSSLFCFDKVYDFRTTNTKLLEWMEDKGFCMFVRATDKFADYYQAIAPQLDPNETVLIYSMWKEYVNSDSKHADQRYIDFISQFPNIEKLHTSGHASVECLAEICNLVNPTLGIIPIHSEDSANFSTLPIKENLREKILTASCNVGAVNIIINQNKE